jgi:CHASE3 domain sensor protein
MLQRCKWFIQQSSVKRYIETGARGFALTGNKAYIEPNALAKPKKLKKYFAFAELD